MKSTNHAILRPSVDTPVLRNFAKVKRKTLQSTILVEGIFPA
jgi:hypothetical protein